MIKNLDYSFKDTPVEQSLTVPIKITPAERAREFRQRLRNDPDQAEKLTEYRLKAKERFGTFLTEYCLFKCYA